MDTDFDLIFAPPHKLVQIVREKLRDGWRVCGSPFPHGSELGIGLVRGEQPAPVKPAPKK